MIVCSNRTIACILLTKFREEFPGWFGERNSPDDSRVPKGEFDRLRPMPTLAMVATVGKNDPETMYNDPGGVKNDIRNSESAPDARRPGRGGWR